MSWQSFVDTNLVGTGQISQAAICGLDGGVWAKSPGFDVKIDEVKKLVEGYNKPEDITASGFTINGEKYFTLQATDRSIYGRRGASGAVCVKSNKAVIISLYGENVEAGNVVNVTEKLCDYFIQLQYSIQTNDEIILLSIVNNTSIFRDVLTDDVDLLKPYTVNALGNGLFSVDNPSTPVL
ncbi:profilin, required for normal timing of actin polymerization in response to thermal stress [Mycoemilia scoparia]|uniref:Profilin n=1 Tax=Mycoemilia scoparia TaxID=417184 RepID=A0A9W7ZQL4_9FUNG|nr:profilin, required for normal timing of actin polymerization in response to thermal stress [Mycoemilia scoparia]